MTFSVSTKKQTMLPQQYAEVIACCRIQGKGSTAEMKLFTWEKILDREGDRHSSTLITCSHVQVNKSKVNHTFRVLCLLEGIIICSLYFKSTVIHFVFYLYSLPGQGTNYKLHPNRDLTRVDWFPTRVIQTPVQGISA